ncbi:MAG: Uma2 family endonuclease [Planctomycetota bacterium]
MPAVARDASSPEQREQLRFSPEEYYALAEQNLIPEHTELVDGQIIKMPAQFYPAVAAIIQIVTTLHREWHDPRGVASDLMHPFPSGWNPRPDVALYDVPPPRRPGDRPHPEPRLVIEVADTTLDYDLGEKAARYADEGVAELWVADPDARHLWVHREPADGTYTSRQRLTAEDTVTPLCLPELPLRVDDLLPAYPDE